MISVFVNDEPYQLKKGSTVEVLIKQMERQDSKRIAIAVNDQVVNRSYWSTHKLSDNDKVLLFAPIQGG